jgi:hypothetical protein
MVCWILRQAHFQEVGLMQISTYYVNVKGLKQHVRPLDASQEP